jgi:DNA-binding transcriptional regulator GbsR (MarR family)
MHIEEARLAFIMAWGSFGVSWGITRTMAQVHALLLVNTRALCTDDVLEHLRISRGNASISLNQLVQWGLIQRVVLAGERKDYYTAEKDVHKIASAIIRERKKREVEPLLSFLENLAPLDDAGANADAQQLTRLTDELRSMVRSADAAMEKFIRADAGWLQKLLIFTAG